MTKKYNHGSGEPYWNDVRIAAPGQVVKHNGRMWVNTYHRYVTQGLSTEPGNEEFTPMWSPLDSHLWRESPIPIVRQRGWRKRETERLIVLQYRMRLNTAHKRLRDANHFQHIQTREQAIAALAVRRDMDEWSRMSREAYQLRRKLGLSVKEVREMVDKHYARRSKKLPAMLRPKVGGRLLIN